MKYYFYVQKGIMNCPYCGNQMEAIRCRDGMIWDSKKGLISTLPPLRGEAIGPASETGPFSGACILYI